MAAFHWKSDPRTFAAALASACASETRPASISARTILKSTSGRGFSALALDVTVSVPRKDRQALKARCRGHKRRQLVARPNSLLAQVLRARPENYVPASRPKRDCNDPCRIEAAA